MTATDVEIQIDEKIVIKTEEPKKYKVLMLNDDVTPMEWVINVLESIFKHSRESAEKLTLTIHTEGSGVAGIYNYEIAEQKAIESTNSSRSNGFPLQLKIEESNE